MEGKGQSHKVFTGDPLHQHSLIHRRVSVTTADLKEHTGWVYTIDPVSERFVLPSLQTEKIHKKVQGFSILTY